jgi:hypothetical protein
MIFFMWTSLVLDGLQEKKVTRKRPYQAHQWEWQSRGEGGKVMACLPRWTRGEGGSALSF